MRALLLQGSELTLDEIERPVPGPGQVLGRVRACGICGSDLHFALYREQNETAARGGRPALGPGRPIVMGHEFVAEIVEAGPDGTPFPAGTRVTGAPWVPDVRVERGWQTIGYSTRYPGGYGEYVVMTAALLNRVPDNLPDAVATTVEPCAVGLHAVREAAVRPEERVLVMGAGPIGLMSLLWLKHDGVRRVAISDYAAPRRALGERIGADLVLDPATANVASEVESAFGGPPDVVFDCVGVAGTLQQAIDLVPRRGRVAVVGVCMTEDTIRPLTGITKHVTLQFMSAYTAEEVAECLRAMGAGEIDTAPMVTRTIRQDELPATFKALGDPQDCKVVVLYP